MSLKVLWTRLKAWRHDRLRAADERALCRVLKTAAARLAAVKGPIWSSYHSGVDIAAFVLRCREGIISGTISSDERRELWAIFAPTMDWDDVVGNVELGNRVFSLLEKLFGAEVRQHRE